MASDCKLSKLFNPAVAATSNFLSTATPKKLEHVLSRGDMKISYSENMMKIERRICMEDKNKEVVTITDEGIIIIDFLIADYTVLIKLIEEDNCMLTFDSEEAYQNLVQGIYQYIRENCTIELGERIIKFIAEEWSQQVEILNYISHD